jgi:hypothetical protein
MISRAIRWASVGAIVASIAACAPTGTTDDASTDVMRADVRDAAVDAPPADAPISMMDAAMDAPALDVTPPDASDASVGDASDVTSGTDASDTTSGTDASDVTSATDASDATVVPDLCAPGALIDLNAVGTLAGATTTYLASNASAPEGPWLETPCAPSGYQVVFSYTMRAAGTLTISTDNPGTPDNFDTVMMGIETCSTSARQLGCLDDSPASGSPRERTSTLYPYDVFPAGATVYVLVGGFDPPTDSSWIAQGTFEISVTEMPTVPLGGECDRTGSGSACTPGSHCITPRDGGAATCVADGSLDGACLLVGAECDAGLGCAFDPIVYPGRCVIGVPIGDTCDAFSSTTACVSGSHCLTNSGASTCVADGTLGGRCTISGPACDAGLACSGAASSSSSRCVTAIAAGDACTPGDTSAHCESGTACVTVAGSTTCRGYAYATVTAPAFIDACATGTVLTTTATEYGHATAAQTLPFTLTFFGMPFTQIWPDTNGYATLGASAPSDSSDYSFMIPDSGEPLPALAPLWTELTMDASSHLCVATAGTAPNRDYVVEYEGFHVGTHPGESLVFEIVLHEDNTIEFVYQTLDAPTSTSTQIGLQLDSTRGIARDRTALTVPTAIRWTPRP